MLHHPQTSRGGERVNLLGPEIRAAWEGAKHPWPKNNTTRARKVQIAPLKKYYDLRSHAATTAEREIDQEKGLSSWKRH